MNNKLLNAILCNTAIEIMKFMSFGKDRQGTMTVTMKMVTECISCGISQDKVQLHQMCRNLCEYTLACHSSLCFYKDTNVIGLTEMSLLSAYVIVTYAHIFLS